MPIWRRPLPMHATEFFSIRARCAAQEEIFGHVLAQISFQDLDEVLKQANDTFYGLSAAVWTRDLQQAHRAARELRVGTVWVNGYGAFDHAMPFGGYKMSGNTREGG